MRNLFLFPLAFLLAAPAGATGDASPKVDVVLADFSFTPRTIQLHAGQRIVLHLANQGSGGHNFSAPDFFAAASIDPASAALVKKGKVEVKKGAAVAIPLTPKAGRYTIKCTHFLHSGFGMKGEIIVN